MFKIKNPIILFGMTSTAAKVLSDFESLAPDEQLLVKDHVISVTESTQRKALDRLCGATAGKGLLAKLIADRAGERARG